MPLLPLVILTSSGYMILIDTLVPYLDTGGQTVTSSRLS